MLWNDSPMPMSSMSPTGMPERSTAAPIAVSAREKASTPISEHVPVDFELRGCPIDKGQLLDVISSFLAGRRPNVEGDSVCAECKRAGSTCVLVARADACLGPVTHAGCGALCPRYQRGCFGCFGPQDAPNTGSMVRVLDRVGVGDDDVRRLFRTFNAWAKPFRDVLTGEEDER